MECIIGITVITVFILGINAHIKFYRARDEKQDGVVSLHGLTYRMYDTTVSDVMMRLSSTGKSAYITTSLFEKISDTEGRVTFGGMKYYAVGETKPGFGSDLFSTYRVVFEQRDNTVLMQFFFIDKLGVKSFALASKNREADIRHIQAYHRFLKELGAHVVRN